MKASTRLKSRFDGFQPIELKTSTKLRLSHDSIFEVAVASIVEVFSAWTVTLRAGDVAVLDERLRAREHHVRDDDDALAIPRRWRRSRRTRSSSASSFAETVTSPVVVTGAFRRCASTELRRSLWSASRK